MKIGFALVLYLSYGIQQPPVVVDNIPSLESCKLAGEVAKKEFTSYAKYICVPQVLPNGS